MLSRILHLNPIRSSIRDSNRKTIVSSCLNHIQYKYTPVLIHKDMFVRSLSWNSVSNASHTTEQDDPTEQDDTTSQTQTSKTNAYRSVIPELDEETKQNKARKQEILLERMRRSKLADALRMEKEKLFEAGDKPLSVKDSFQFPLLSVESLMDGHVVDLQQSFPGHVTLVTVSFNGLGKKQTDVFSRAYAEAFGLQGQRDASGAVVQGAGGAQLIDIHYYDGITYSLLGFILKRGLRKATPEEAAPYTHVKFQKYVPKTEDFCYDAKIHNRAMGHVYLIDRNGLVRWRAHQYATEDELEGMVKTAIALMDEVL